MSHPSTASRRDRIRAAHLNGVDAVEVGDDGVTLAVTFLGKAPHGLCPENVRIDGGRRITGIEVMEISVEREEDPELDDKLYVTVDRAGDTSAYRLSLVDTDPYGRPGTEPFPGFARSPRSVPPSPAGTATAPTSTSPGAPSASS
ncbi:putative baseplate assembly protein, partial [Streptomyces asiaticus]